MSGDSEKLDLVLKRIDEINAAIAKMSEELRVLSASVKSLAVGQITSPPTVHIVNAPKPTVAPTPKPTPSVTTTPKPQASPTSAPTAADSGKIRTQTDIRMSFPEDLEARLQFDEKGEYIIIKPKAFLGSDNFAKIASAVRGMGGEYISAGKDSHFRVPKKKA